MGAHNSRVPAADNRSRGGGLEKNMPSFIDRMRTHIADLFFDASFPVNKAGRTVAEKAADVVDGVAAHRPPDQSAYESEKAKDVYWRGTDAAGSLSSFFCDVAKWIRP